MNKTSLYVRRDLINVEDLNDWAVEQNIPFVKSPHVTIVYSKAKVYIDELKFDNKNVRIKGGNRKIESFDSNATVLQFESDLLTNRWNYFLEQGCSWDYKEYKPHITISYSYKDDVKFLKPYRGVFLFGPEIYEPLNNDWMDK